MEAAAGIYTRIMFPDAAVKSDPQLSDMQKAMLDATPDCIKVVSVDGKLLTMNRAGCLALNVPEDSEFGMPWLPLLSEDVHAAGAEALRKAVAGQTARFAGKSLSPDGTTGDTASIPRGAVTTFALFLHEFATNSVKYGALSREEGAVTVGWTVSDGALDLTWTETGGPPIPSPPKRRGFGTEMVDRVVRSTGGVINRDWRTEGLVAELHFPRG